MEILGKINTHNASGYIVRVTQSEMTMLTEKDYKLNTGDNVDVSKIYKQLIFLSENRFAIDRQVKTLRTIADFLEPLKDVVVEAIKQAEVK